MISMYQIIQERWGDGGGLCSDTQHLYKASRCHSPIIPDWEGWRAHWPSQVYPPQSFRSVRELVSKVRQNAYLL